MTIVGYADDQGLTMKTELRLASIAIVLFVTACGSGGKQGQTLGFVVVSRMPAIYETKYMEECPDGLAQSYYANWYLSASREERARAKGKSPRFAALRGPNGENVCWNPTLVKDPPLPLIEGKIAYGLNLDGEESGKASARSCPHENFVSPNGVHGVDNQLYRILGCIYGWRRHGEVESNADVERRDTSQGIMLIELSGVDDVQNDDHVQVSFYKKDGRDPLPKDSEGKILPYASYRIDDVSRYRAVITGRIKNGVLTSEPVDARWASFGNESFDDLKFRGMRVQIPIDPSARSVKGILAGYYTFDSWWNYIAKSEVHAGAGHYSCPAIYEASRRLADGYPDPETGECTALSSAFHLNLVPAFIQKTSPEAADARTASAPDVGNLDPPPPVPAEVTVQSTEAGWYFRDANGHTLYTYKQDGHSNRAACNLGPLASFVEKCRALSPSEQAATRRGQSSCTGECAKAWPPLLAPADAKPVGEWELIAREDGSQQWAFRGKPLYRNSKDAYAGARYGEEGGSADTWHIAFWPRPMPENVGTVRTTLGRVLTDANRMTLYALDPGTERSEESGCAEGCARHWHPLQAGWTSRPAAAWSAVVRKDGTRQWAYNGKPLFTYELDRAPGDVFGEGRGAHAALLEPAADRPLWVTSQRSDMGRIFANADGLTLYAFSADRERISREVCNAKCWETYWRPVIASPDAKPVANWSVIRSKDGSRQWAYKGHPLYTHTHDASPGEVYGHLFGVGMSIVSPWEPILDLSALPNAS